MDLFGESKMNFVLFVLLGVFSSLASASEAKVFCLEVPGKSGQSRGKITYQILDQACSGSFKNGRACVQLMATDQDRCQDSKTLIKKSCSSLGRPQEEKIACPCSHGVCNLTESK